MLEGTTIQFQSKNSETFDYNTAFSRSLGWLTPVEQEKISEVKIGIVGLGGVGGQYSEILTRLGVRHFVIYDQDQFAVENTNRQNECKTSTYGRNKAEVIGELILDINPTAQVEAYARALRIEDVDSFCNKVDIYLDSLDFFEIDVRMAIFKKMKELGKPALTLAPVGTGTAFLLFTKDSMSFDDYFGFKTTKDAFERSLLFLLGVAPDLMHSKYIQDPSRADFAARKVPSLPIGVYSCASMAATMILKLVLKRGDVYAAPYSIHFDPYLLKIKKRYVWWGYRNPFQRMKFCFLKKYLGRRNEF